ncbi:GH39 family glycosyl hydrolase [Terracidiphilus gabretensis]|uniref:GH39 family glycosyl hydrolase n=1 Tax=Terracidiphilus gabretensis TaxID=1577687 RepID=UPI00071B3500|nr:beta-xylosidase [Terracidiphilus gabretensis]
MTFARCACGFAFGLLSLPVIGQGTVPELPSHATGAPVHIVVDLAKPVGPYKPIYSWFGYDEGNYTTMRDGRKLLAELHDLSPVPVYIRAHHLLTSGDGVAELKWSSTNVYREDASGKPIYDFAILDGIFDEFKAAGVRPMVELGFMPKDLAASLPDRKEYQVHFPKSTISGASNNPPKDYVKWGELARVVTAHLVERYGQQAVLQWYFEVWNEPDIDYWHGSAEDYWKLYDYAVAGVRAALPGARVGGPATTSPRNDKANGYLQGFLTHVAAGKSAATGGAIPLDFISFHVKGSPQILNGQVQMGLDKELKDADRGFATIASFAKFRELPIILSEADPEGCAACSSKMNPANDYRNGTLYPAYTAAAYKALFELQDKYQVNLISMLSWSFEFENRDYFEGFRSVSTNGIDEPVLNLFRMLGMMQGTRVDTRSDAAIPLNALVASGAHAAADIDTMATKGANETEILLWNYRDSEETAAAPTTLTITGMPSVAKRVLVKQYRIDTNHSNAYTVWKAMGSPQHPTAEQYSQLLSREGLELVGSPAWRDVKDGQVEVKAELPSESVSLVQVSW